MKWNIPTRNALIASTLFCISTLTPITDSSANPFTIREDIMNKLDNVRTFGRHEFDVEVQGTTVLLEGFVSSAKDKDDVERIARSTNGVSTVINKLTINGPSAVVDNDIAKHIRDSVKARAHIKGYKLDIGQQDGQVILSGEVASIGDRQEIESIANSLAAGNKVVNQLVLAKKEVIPDSIVQSNVLAALKNEGATGFETLSVSAKDGIVYFDGQINDHRQIDKILSIALMVDGVKSVRSNVKVLHPTSP